MRSLVLDQSTNIVGWCVVEDDPTRPVAYGVAGRLVHAGGRITTATGVGVASRVASILLDVRHLLAARNIAPVDALVLEETGFIKQKSAATNYALNALKWELEKLARALGIGFYTVPVGKVKLLATGSGKADKDAMIAGATRYWGTGVRVQDHNHADALCAALYWLAHGPEIRGEALAKNV